MELAMWGVQLILSTSSFQASCPLQRHTFRLMVWMAWSWRPPFLCVRSHLSGSRLLRRRRNGSE